MIPKRLRPVSLPLRPGSRSSTVRRSSDRSFPTPDSWSIARTGRSRKRFDIPAAVVISLRPMPVIWSTFLPNSGDCESSAISSATKPSTLVSSADFFSESIAPGPEAFSGTTIGTGSGGVSSSSIAGLVVVSVVVAIRCPLPAFATVLGGQDTLFKDACLSRPELAATRRGAEGGLASGENAGDRMHLRGAGGERVGEQQHRDRDRGEAGDDALRGVRESSHFISPLIRPAGDP